MSSSDPAPDSAPTLAPVRRLGRNVTSLGAVSFLTDVSSEMIYPLLPLFLSGVLGASASFIGVIEGVADTVSSLLKLASGWWSDRIGRRKPLVVLGYTIASVVRPLLGLAQSATQVLGIRVADRVGKGIRNAPRDALIADSVPESIRGRAFGFHRAADHAGAVFGPLVAFALLERGNVALRTVFLVAAIPGLLSVLVLVVGVREVPRTATALAQPIDLSQPLGTRFWSFLAVLFIFTLGNSTDAFLLLRATELGVSAALIPVLWSVLHLVKSASSLPGGALSDVFGRKPLIIAGWVIYAAVYFGFANASAQWHAWALFAIYGLFFGLTEGGERALVADLVPPARRGAAFGWYNLAIAAGALPASVVFGAIWDRAGAPAAFTFGATLALTASVGLLIVASSRGDRAGKSATA